MDENVPGLAMSRSFGDRVAAQAGVISVPEIYETRVTMDDKFLIIASDGIWEFIPNDEAVEMVVPFWRRGDPEGACDKLIQEAVKNWEQEDEVIDDITVIVVFFSQ
jgi:serine/threonine protein phosphatase PrpC